MSLTFHAVPDYAELHQTTEAKTMRELTTVLKEDISCFITNNWEGFIADAKEYDGLDITLATNEDGDTWNYQTGDNSYTGGCYSLPHWAVETITIDSIPSDIILSLLNQLDELLID